LLLHIFTLKVTVRKKLMHKSDYMTSPKITIQD